ncbi:MAG: putative phospholipid ABC transporter permease protein MlaE [Planctomycetes bacterium ADurb.Bin401]|nr:MAG: putative phospholipid ABC transporter permease protein MlaE [Planctomycetes bacterium ADurb.Bin401]
MAENEQKLTMIEQFGAGFIKAVSNTGRFARFQFDSLLASVAAFFTPRTYSLIWNQMLAIGVRSVPVVMITGAFVGMVLAIQAYDQLAGLGIEEHLGVLINLSVVKELGPVLAAVMLAGRVGGALTAELGTMNVTEQILAVRSMGTDPIKYLVAPRMIACLLLTPVLIIYADFLGIIGGYLISVPYLEINSRAYWNFSAGGVELWDITIGIAKGFFFGAAIAGVSCYKGFHCREGAEGVGQACTEGFVGSFIIILAIDFVLVVVFKAIYASLWPVKLLL